MGGGRCSRGGGVQLEVEVAVASGAATCVTAPGARCCTAWRCLRAAKRAPRACRRAASPPCELTSMCAITDAVWQLLQEIEATQLDETFMETAAAPATKIHGEALPSLPAAPTSRPQVCLTTAGVEGLGAGGRLPWVASLLLADADCLASAAGPHWTPCHPSRPAAGCAAGKDARGAGAGCSGGGDGVVRPRERHVESRRCRRHGRRGQWRWSGGCAVNDGRVWPALRPVVQHRQRCQASQQ